MELDSWHFSRDVPTIFGQPVSQNTFEKVIGMGFYMFSKPNNYVKVQ